MCIVCVANRCVNLQRLPPVAQLVRDQFAWTLNGDFLSDEYQHNEHCTFAVGTLYVIMYCSPIEFNRLPPHLPNLSRIQGTVALTVGSSQNYVIFIDCWKWTINQIDVIKKRSYVRPILLLVQRPPVWRQNKEPNRLSSVLLYISPTSKHTQIFC